MGILGVSIDIHLQVDKNSGASLSWQVEKDIEQQISTGLWAGQKKIPDERLLTHLYGVSRPTIRKAIGGLCDKGLLVRHRGRGTFIVGDKLALQRSHASRSIMVIAGDFDIFGRILKGVEREALRRGYGVAVGERGRGSEKDKMHLRMAAERQVAGILYEASYLLTKADFRCVRKSDIPVVFIEKDAAIEEDFVGGDNRAGMALAVHHLHMLGHRRIGYVHHGRSQDAPTQPERLAGFREACKTHGLHVDDRWIVTLESLDGEAAGDETKLCAVLDLRPGERPTAMCCFNDNVATFVMKSAMAKGISVPGDLSIVGWDDTEKEQPHVTPLTSLATAAQQIGVEAARLLFEKIEHGEPAKKRRITVEPALRIRQSTAQAPDLVEMKPSEKRMNQSDK